MRAVDVCSLMVLLGLCGCGSLTESTELSTKQTTPDIWAEMRALRDTVAELTLQVKQLQGQNTEKPKVAFYTGLTDAGHVGPHTTAITLKYSNVHTNIGNAYNQTTGHFTAPVRGVYYLQFTAAGLQKASMAVQVYKNNQIIMNNYRHKSERGMEYITNSVVLELIAGDEIHLHLPSGYILYDNPNNQNTFSGALLFTLP